jgi:hypothetical protein
MERDKKVRSMNSEQNREEFRICGNESKIVPEDYRDTAAGLIIKML